MPLDHDPTDPRDWCAHCKTPLPLDWVWGRRKFCSVECKNADYAALLACARDAARKGMTCRECGKPIDAGRTDVLYCSRRCTRRAYRRRWLPERSCERCGAAYRPCRRGQRYCGQGCYKATRTVLTPRPCEHCGDTFRPRTGQRFCSKACKTTAQWMARRCEPAAGGFACEAA